MPLVPQEIPKIGLVMEAVTILRWLKHVGDAITAGEPLLEVESEKSVVEIEAAATGRLSQILVEADGQAAVGDQVAWIEVVESAPASIPRDVKAAATPEPSADAPAAAAHPGSTERIASTPVARKLAAEHGVDLGAMRGTGPGGRIQLDDVQRVLEAPQAQSPVAASSGRVSPVTEAAGAASLSPMRRALARSMTLSNATVPQFTVSRQVELTRLQTVRAALAARMPADSPKLTVTDFLLYAVAAALLEFPALNATFSGDAESADARIVPSSGAHIGLVVAVDNGLLVPVIHGVQDFGLAELARRRQDCVERALRGRLKRDELEGATFSISNLGADGPDRFTAIINPPQSAILAVGRRRECVLPRDGDIVVRPMSDLTMTVDHRVADGRLAAQFLARLVALLEGSDWRP